MSGLFFKDVVQVVLLLGAETWVVNPCMVKALGGVQYHVARRLMGRLPQRTPDGKRIYTLKATEQ